MAVSADQFKKALGLVTMATPIHYGKRQHEHLLQQD